MAVILRSGCFKIDLPPLKVLLSSEPHAGAGMHSTARADENLWPIKSDVIQPGGKKRGKSNAPLWQDGSTQGHCLKLNCSLSIQKNLNIQSLQYWANLKQIFLVVEVSYALEKPILMFSQKKKKVEPHLKSLRLSTFFHANKMAKLRLNQQH